MKKRIVSALICSAMMLSSFVGVPGSGKDLSLTTLNTVSAATNYGGVYYVSIRWNQILDQGVPIKNHTYVTVSNTGKYTARDINGNMKTIDVTAYISWGYFQLVYH
ncbi:MAG: hypothetical protein Q4F95_12290 [Oscillospiraceae bacterium]|nr:hypothetical protein [Oscillospiraceae bacterium]